ncbi:alpha-glucosidase [Calliopsis andreniformis]|uniref:alpha-glucosidase n=1 Tax=Calliopsis andreniformis TaxID=337506 RepID=UPI003FCE9A1C
MRAVIVFCITLLSVAAGHDQNNDEWWRTMSLYQIYPRSYMDSDGDGVGDIKGIMIKLDHLVESKVDAFWLSPFYPSPMVDFGYDISDFLSIDPVFGSMKDFEDLVSLAHDMDLKVVVDFVPNHSSDQHDWFKLSLLNAEPYKDYYVWRKGRVLENGTIVPPNNWVSVFGGSAWTWREERQEYYLHQFAPEQPDLNYNNENVVREMQNVMRYWLSKGVDGFRVDAVPHLCEDSQFLDEPLSGTTNDPNNYGYTEKTYTKDQPLTYEIVRGWRGVLDEYNTSKVMMIEAYTNISMTMKYYEVGAHFPFNFGIITDLNMNSTAADFKRVIDQWMTNMPAGCTANWVAGNHDRPRLVTRFGPQRARAVSLLTLLLPGIGVTYNGEEIGMEDTWISWEETVDPQGCNAGVNGFETASRDPCRTPFQWDNSTSAGFSTNPHTWLPVNDNYPIVNLEREEEERDSYYRFYKEIAKMRNSATFEEGILNTKVFNDNVLAFSRESAKAGSAYVLINLGTKEETVDLSAFDNVSSQVIVSYTSVGSDLTPGSASKDINNVKIPASGIVIYTSNSQSSQDN